MFALNVGLTEGDNDFTGNYILSNSVSLEIQKTEHGVFSISFIMLEDFFIIIFFIIFFFFSEKLLSLWQFSSDH